MPTPRSRVLSISLAAVVLLAAAGCAEATVVRASWGTPLEAVTAAGAGLAEGVSFQGWTTASAVELRMHGEEIPDEEKFRLYQSVDNGMLQLDTELRLIGDEMWMRIDGMGGDGDWGHFANGTMIAAMSNVVGPSEWVPELLAQITTVERVGEREYGGVLDLTEADPDKTGLEKAITRDLPDEAEEVEFSVVLNLDGSLNTFTYEIEDTDQGDLEVTYSFTMHGSPNDVTKPDGKIVEVTDENAMDWLSGG